MPIKETDIVFKCSGSENMGGAIGPDDVSENINALFPVVSGKEALSGDVKYRCLYVKNEHPTLTLYNTLVFIRSNTPSEDTYCEIGLGSSAIGGEEQIIPTEHDIPQDVNFSAPLSDQDALLLGDLLPGEWKAIWIRRTVSAEAVAFNNDCLWLAVYGDTAA